MSQTDRPKRPADLECPHCQKMIHLENVARYMDDTKVVVRATPHPGTILEAEAVAGLIGHSAKLLKALSAELGARAIVSVPAITMDEKGELAVTLQIARVSKSTKKGTRATPQPLP